MWTKETIASLLTHNDRAVERAIVAIYNRQTIDEQNCSTTKHHNGMGFSGAHAAMGTYWAKWILSGRRLTGSHLAKARRMSLHYLGQLLEVAEAKSNSMAA